MRLKGLKTIYSTALFIGLTLSSKDGFSDTLKQLMNKAEIHSIEMKSLRHQIDLAKINLKSSASGMLPRVDFKTRQELDSHKNNTSRSSKIVVEAPLFDAKSLSKVSTLKLDHEISKLKLNISKNDLFYRVFRIYIQYQMINDIIDLSRKMAKSLESQIKLEREMVQSKYMTLLESKENTFLKQEIEQNILKNYQDIDELNKSIKQISGDDAEISREHSWANYIPQLELSSGTSPQLKIKNLELQRQKSINRNDISRFTPRISFFLEHNFTNSNNTSRRNFAGIQTEWNIFSSGKDIYEGMKNYEKLKFLRKDADNSKRNESIIKRSNLKKIKHIRLRLSSYLKTIADYQNVIENYKKIQDAGFSNQSDSVKWKRNLYQTRLTYYSLKVEELLTIADHYRMSGKMRMLYLRNIQ